MPEQSKNNIITHSESSATPQFPSRAKHPMEALLKGGSISFFRVGDIVEGKIIHKHGTRVFVDLGPLGTGIVYGREYYTASDIIRHMKIGDMISAKVVELDNPEGYTELSLREAGEEKRWSDLNTIMKGGETLELPVLEANRGGLILEYRGIKGFLPASQLSAKNYPRIEGGDKEKIYQELQKLIGTMLRIKIIVVSPHENKLIFTEKIQDSAENASGVSLAQYSAGQEVEGEITTVVDFGAFMKFDPSGLEGLIHISEIDWMLIGHPSDVLSTGQKVRAKIIDIQGNKISFSLKRLKEDPWEYVSKNFHRGDVVQGEVARFNTFGAFVFVDIEKNDILIVQTAAGENDAEIKTAPVPIPLRKKVQGLAHISEFGTEEKMKEILEAGKSYNFKILLVEPKEHRLSLGLV